MANSPQPRSQMMGIVQTKSDLCALIGKDHSGKVNLVVMAYVDGLVSASESVRVKKDFKDIQETFSLKHIDFLNPNHPIEFLGRIVKKRLNGQITT